jgi:hypothetical protein
MVSLLLTDMIYGLGAFQASLNILIHYERCYNVFYVPYFHIQLLGCNPKIMINLNLTSSCIHDDINVYVGTEVFPVKS